MDPLSDTLAFLSEERTHRLGRRSNLSMFQLTSTEFFFRRLCMETRWASDSRLFLIGIGIGILAPIVVPVGTICAIEHYVNKKE